MKIGNSLKYFRKKNGYTQMEIAKILSIKQSTYSGYETDYAEPDLDTLDTLASLYEISIDILIGRVETRKAV